MKKTTKTCLSFVLVLVGLIISCLGVMFLTNFCPPQGPWSMPPWCKNEATIMDVPTETAFQPESTKSVQLPTETPVSYVYELPQEYNRIFSKPEWEQYPTLPSDFMLGHTFMDIYTTDLFRTYLEPTLDSMRDSRATWVVYNNYWSYKSFDPPIIAPYPETQGFRNATSEEICMMVQETHVRGMKFALMTELTFDIARGEWQDWDHQSDFWQQSQQLLAEKGDNIPANNEWWDAWFESYGAFVFNQASTAKQCNVDMLVIGKQIDGAVRIGNANHWRELIAETREIYSGPLSYAAWTDQNYSEANEFPFDALDYIIIYLYNKVSDVENPTLSELTRSFERFNDRQFELLSREYGKPIIFLTPFQSRDYGAQQVWFEPADVAPNVGEDLLIQASLYEAFFQAIQDEDWVAGVWTWGYWWRDDFDTIWQPGDASFHKSSSVRNKPAMWIIRNWAEGIGKSP